MLANIPYWGLALFASKMRSYWGYSTCRQTIKQVLSDLSGGFLNLVRMREYAMACGKPLPSDFGSTLCSDNMYVELCMYIYMSKLYISIYYRYLCYIINIFISQIVANIHAQMISWGSHVPFAVRWTNLSESLVPWLSGVKVRGSMSMEYLQ